MPKGVGYTAELIDGNDSITLGPDDVHGPQFPDEDSVINRWEFSTPYNESLEEWRHADLRLWFDDADGNTRLIGGGPVDDIKSDDSRGMTRVVGRDSTAKLKRSGGVVSYDSIEGWQAVEDFWLNEVGLPPEDVTVLEPPGTTGDEGVVLVQASSEADFETILTSEATNPIVNDGGPRLAQAGFWQEAEDDFSGGTVINDDAYSGGDAVRFEDFASATTKSFSIDYDIPADEIEFKIRLDLDDTGHDSFRLIIDNDVVETIPADVLSGGLRWFSTVVDGVGGLSAGSHTAEIEFGRDAFGEERCIVDAWWIGDNRFEWTEDNSVDGPGGYLDGPELFPPSATANYVESDTEGEDIRRAELTTNYDDISGEQSVAISFDDGATWEVEANSETIERDSDDPTTTVEPRTTLSRYGTQSNASPKTGINGQSISSLTLAVDTADVIVFSDREYVGDDYARAQEIHEDAGLIFVVQAKPDGGIEVESFEEGQVLGDAGGEWTRLGFDRGYATKDYANKIVVIGGVDDNGNRVIGEAESESEINQRGEEPDYIIERGETDQNTLQNIARVELERALREDQLVGSVDIVPRRLTPGYRYEVPALDGREAVLQQVQFSDGRQPRGTLSFEQPRDIATAVSSLRKSVRRERL